MVNRSIIGKRERPTEINGWPPYFSFKIGELWILTIGILEDHGQKEIHQINPDSYTDIYTDTRLPVMNYQISLLQRLTCS